MFVHTNNVEAFTLHRIRELFSPIVLIPVPVPVPVPETTGLRSGVISQA